MPEPKSTNPIHAKDVAALRHLGRFGHKFATVIEIDGKTMATGEFHTVDDAVQNRRGDRIYLRTGRKFTPVA